MMGQWERFLTHAKTEVLVFDRKYTTIPVLQDMTGKQAYSRAKSGPVKQFMTNVNINPPPGFIQPQGHRSFKYLFDLRGLAYLFESTGTPNGNLFLKDFADHGYTDVYVRPVERNAGAAPTPKKRVRSAESKEAKGVVKAASLVSPQTEIDYSFSSSLEQEDKDEIDLATLVRINNNNSNVVTPTKKIRAEPDPLTLVSAAPLPPTRAPVSVPAPAPARAAVPAPAPAPSPVVAAAPKPVPARAPGPAPAPHPVRASVPATPRASAPTPAPAPVPSPAPHPVAVQKKKTAVAYDPEIMQEFVRANEDKYRAFLAERLASTMSMADMTALLKKGQN